MRDSHSFHIPVMGIGFTLETPLKVSQYGMESVISLVDDMLLEKLRKFYCEKFKIPYTEITEKIDDHRAKRITSYLNMVHGLAKKNFESVINSGIEKAQELKKYFSMLPDSATLLSEFNKMIDEKPTMDDLKHWIQEKLTMGSIDVNIMTKVDKVNYKDGEALDHTYNDAHAAMRGYANSELSSSLVLSAGMNPRLYGYLAEFKDFFPDENSNIKKKIILKVSDYRSAIIQGKFLAKKGLWVSEYRIESGLNCGGHAFASEGYLLGPVLAEFKNSRQDLVNSTFELLQEALKIKGYPVPSEILPIKITAQGGVGTAEEHRLLIDEFNLDSVGWGTPFLLVPEATTVDEKTLEKLIQAKEEDLFLSGISPLGVPFNNLRDNSKDLERDSLIEIGRPGSSCPKKYVSINSEFTDHAICTGSREYQHNKIKELKGKDLSTAAYQKEYDAITEKSCICVGLGTGSLLVHGIETRSEGQGVSICPGPNLAYFSDSFSLKTMTDHIYGRQNIIFRKDRPHMFIKELKIYMDYLKDKIAATSFPANRKDLKYLNNFTKNMNEGIEYYKNIFNNLKNHFQNSRTQILNELEQELERLNKMMLKIK